MKKKLSHYTMLSLLLFTSCATEEFTLFDDGAIRLNVACQQPTRGTSGVASQQTVFDANAKLNVYIATSDGTTISDNQTFTASAPSAGKNTLTPPDPSRPPYYPNGDKTVTIKAYYPSSVTNTTTTFSVASDQTVVSTDELVDTYKKSDLMTATVTGQVKTAEPVNLQFTHRMAKIVINATASDNLVIKSIKLTNVQTNATYNSSADTWSGTGATGTITVATAEESEELSTLSGVALFPSQTVEGKDFIQVETNRGTAKFVVTSKLFQEGYEYTLDLEVGLQNLTMTAAITDWNAASGTATVTKVLKYGMSIDPIDETFIYTGTAQTPSTVKVYDVRSESDKTLLTEGTHYHLSYYNNTAVGSALVVAEGIGSYGGSAAVQSYIISKATPILSFDTETVEREFSWNDTYSNSLSEGSKYDGVLIWTSSDTNVATVDGNGVITISKPGTITVKVENDGSGNYETASAQYTLHITKRVFKNHVSITDLGTYEKKYDGSEKKPVPVVYDGQHRLGDNDGYYAIAYTNNINAGDDVAAVTLTGTGVYYDNTTVSKTFDIDKVTPVITMSTTAKTIGVGTTYECGATTDYGTIVYSSSDATVATVNSSTGLVTAIKNGTANITASIAAGDNWNAATTKSVTITVQKQEESWTSPGAYTYVCPVNAIYTFEVVGAAGGNYSGGTGGYAGIVKCKKKLTANTSIYIYVGSQGQAGSGVAGGTNGSDTGYGGMSGTSGGGSGGACTEIRIGGTAVSNRHIVAGGGGGSSGKRRSGRDGGTSTSGGYRYAYGENATYYSVSGGGGGGYYGGRQGTFMGGGYGGSNYLDSSWTIISAGTTTNGPRSASDSNSYNGYVKMTYEIE